MASTGATWRRETLGRTVRVVDEQGNDVAIIGDVNAPHVPQHADLIAAAPKMLEALHGAQAGLELGACLCKGDFVCSRCLALDAVLLTIDLAQGR